MNPKGTSRPPLPPEEAAQVAHALGVLRNPKAEKAERAKELEVIAGFLQRYLFEKARWHAGNIAGLSAGELFQTAFVNLLQTLALPTSPPVAAAGETEDDKRRIPEDAEQLRAAFCDLLYKRYIDELRQRSRHPGDYGAGHGGKADATVVPELPASPKETHRRLQATLRLTALQDALLWLDESHPRLSAAFKARLLSNHDIRFSQAGRSMSRFVRERVSDEERTFAEMGELLGCPPKLARERYMRAVELIRERFPELLEAGKEAK